MDNDVSVAVETSICYLSIPVSYQISIRNVKLCVPMRKCKQNVNLGKWLIHFFSDTYTINELIDVHANVHLFFPYQVTIQ